jgi:hypothetical protein
VEKTVNMFSQIFFALLPSVRTLAH